MHDIALWFEAINVFFNPLKGKNTLYNFTLMPYKVTYIRDKPCPLNELVKESGRNLILVILKGLQKV